MAGKKLTTPRKLPTQARAIATLDAILQAATYILVERGWEGFNTNHVAERAGVNIASLYQYFPSKEAIVAELQRRHIAEVRRGLPKLEDLLAEPSLRSLFRAIVDAVIREHRIAPALHRVFAEELPRFARRPVGMREHELDQIWRECVVPRARVPDPEMAFFVVRTTLHDLIHTAANHKPELLDSPLFRDEAVALLERYLRRPRRRARVARRPERRAGAATRLTRRARKPLKVSVT